MRIIIMLLLLFISTGVLLHADDVVLLHGLSRTSASMEKIEALLTQKGHRVLNIDYQSSKKNIQAIVYEEIIPRLRLFCNTENRPVHFVTHSMGGIVLRYLLSTTDEFQAGRIVMLSPPNHGSEVVDFFAGNILAELLMGPAFFQLSKKPGSFVNTLPPVRAEIGVITGSATINFINSIIIPGADDGKVSLESARLTEMQDFLVVRRTHPFIMQAPEVHSQIVYFLEHGAFER